jgi:hypothetical protein
MVFTSTEGKYSAYDYAAHGATPWGYRGIFLADLTPVTNSYLFFPGFASHANPSLFVGHAEFDPSWDVHVDSF